MNSGDQRTHPRLGAALGGKLLGERQHLDAEPRHEQAPRRRGRDRLPWRVVQDRELPVGHRLAIELHHHAVAPWGPGAWTRVAPRAHVQEVAVVLPHREAVLGLAHELAGGAVESGDGLVAVVAAVVQEVPQEHEAEDPAGGAAGEGVGGWELHRAALDELGLASVFLEQGVVALGPLEQAVPAHLERLAGWRRRWWRGRGGASLVALGRDAEVDVLVVDLELVGLVHAAPRVVELGQHEGARRALALVEVALEQLRPQAARAAHAGADIRHAGAADVAAGAVAQEPQGDAVVRRLAADRRAVAGRAEDHRAGGHGLVDVQGAHCRDLRCVGLLAPEHPAVLVAAVEVDEQVVVPKVARAEGLVGGGLGHEHRRVRRVAQSGHVVRHGPLAVAVDHEVGILDPPVGWDATVDDAIGVLEDAAVVGQTDDHHLPVVRVVVGEVGVVVVGVDDLVGLVLPRHGVGVDAVRHHLGAAEDEQAVVGLGVESLLDQAVHGLPVVGVDAGGADVDDLAVAAEELLDAARVLRVALRHLGEVGEHHAPGALCLGRGGQAHGTLGLLWGLDCRAILRLELGRDEGEHAALGVEREDEPLGEAEVAAERAKDGLLLVDAHEEVAAPEPLDGLDDQPVGHVGELAADGVVGLGAVRADRSGHAVGRQALDARVRLHHHIGARRRLLARAHEGAHQAVLLGEHRGLVDAAPRAADEGLELGVDRVAHVGRDEIDGAEHEAAARRAKLHVAHLPAHLLRRPPRHPEVALHVPLKLEPHPPRAARGRLGGHDGVGDARGRPERVEHLLVLAQEQAGHLLRACRRRLVAALRPHRHLHGVGQQAPEPRRVVLPDCRLKPRERLRHRSAALGNGDHRRDERDVHTQTSEAQHLLPPLCCVRWCWP